MRVFDRRSGERAGKHELELVSLAVGLLEFLMLAKLLFYGR